MTFDVEVLCTYVLLEIFGKATPFFSIQRFAQDIGLLISTTGLNFLKVHNTSVSKV